MAAQGPAIPWPPGPPPAAQLHHWDGPDVGRIHLLEVLRGREIERLGEQNIRNTVNAARMRLSNAVNLEIGNANDDARRDAALAVCDSVSIVEDIVAPVANGPANLANDRVQKFKFQLAGPLEGLAELMRLSALLEDASSGRHTTTGINFDAVVQGPAETPEWKVFQNGLGINVAQRNSHASHEDYTAAFDMGAAINPFDQDVLHPISPHVTDVRSKPGGLHYLENFPEGNPPQPLMIPAGADAHPNPWDVVADGPMPHLDAFGRHFDEHYIDEPWDMLISQVSCCISRPSPLNKVSFYLKITTSD